jgi:GDPmannose 4,6-dehydratase
LGNINSKRDWGHAKDYVKAMWLMLQRKVPCDYVIGTGKTYSVKEFIKIAFDHVGLKYNNYIKIDKKLFRPTEVDLLKADYTKAKKELKWKPGIPFKKLVIDMVDSDIKFINDNYRNE